MEYINNRMIKPVIIGGVITGILTSIFSLIGGCCCCILYILSGVITAYLLTQEYLPSDRDYPISGGLSGGVAGFVNWLLSTVLSIVHILIYGSMSISYMKIIETYFSSTLTDFVLFALFLLIAFLIHLLLGATFGVIGAILYRIVMEEMMKR